MWIRSQDGNVEKWLEIAEKATPGPWDIKREDIGDEYFCYVPVEIIGADAFPVVSIEGGLAPNCFSFKAETLEANAELIKISRNNFPDLCRAYLELLAEVERLHNLLAERNVLLDKQDAELERLQGIEAAARDLTLFNDQVGVDIRDDGADNCGRRTYDLLMRKLNVALEGGGE